MIGFGAPETESCDARARSTVDAAAERRGLATARVRPSCGHRASGQILDLTGSRDVEIACLEITDPGMPSFTRLDRMRQDEPPPDRGRPRIYAEIRRT
jgi:hypothetical protein